MLSHEAMRPLIAASVLATLLATATPGRAHMLADRLAPDHCRTPPALIENPGAVPPGLVAELLTWIGEATDYDLTTSHATPPDVAFCRIGDVIPYESGTALVDETLNGAYDLSNHRVILVQPWDAKTPRDRSVLLHELIHHVQLENRGYECLQAPEWEAYELQEAYLAQQGVDAGFDWLQIYFLSRCPRDHHP